MNETKLENQLRSWIPRQPSAKIQAALFDAARKSRSRPSATPSGALNWFLPATASFLAMLLVLSISNNRPSHFGERPAGPLLAAMMLDGATLTNLEQGMQTFALTAIDLNLEWNICFKATFESTNHSQTPSSIDSLPVAKTNQLML